MREFWAAVGQLWKGFVNFRGRCGAKPFWLAMGFLVGTVIIALAIDTVLIISNVVAVESSSPMFSVTMVWLVVTVVPGVAMIWRRLLDSGRSGWWIVVPVATLVMAVILTEDTSGDGWVPFATVFFAVATLVVAVMIVVFLLTPGPSVTTRWGAPIAISVVASFALSLGVFPVVTTDGVINYNRVSQALGLGPLWEREFPDGCGEFSGMLSNFDNWNNPMPRDSGWGHVEFFTTDMPPDRLACVQSHTIRDTRRGFLYQRVDEEGWLALRDVLITDGFSDVYLWGSSGVMLTTLGDGETGETETEIVFYGESDTLLYVWTDDRLWLRDTYSDLPDYLGGISGLSGTGREVHGGDWALGDVTQWRCDDFSELLDGRTGFSVVEPVTKEEWKNWGAPRRQDEPDDYLLCSHSSPDDFHSGRVFRLQTSSDGEAEYRVLASEGFDEVRWGELRGLFREQTFEPSEDSHGGVQDELYVFGRDGWAYFVTSDNFLYVDDPYLDIPQHVNSTRPVR
jgi:uncharacterized membrane protein YhaH (DUF805 family)